MIMASRQLQSAYKLMEQGQKKDAAQLVREVLAQDKNNANAWWLMAMLLEDETKKVRAIERVLAINPDHKAARAKINQLRSERQTGQNMMATQEMMNLDWSKLKDDPHPEKTKKKDATADDQKIVTYGLFALGGFVVLVIVLVAGSFVMNFLNQPSMPPDEATIAYLDALGTNNFEQLAGLTCSQHQDTVEVAYQNLLQWAGFVGAENLSFDLSGLTATVTNNSDTSATVQLSGEITIGAFDVTRNFTVDELANIVGGDPNISLVLENNEWRVCEALPE